MWQVTHASIGYSSTFSSGVPGPAGCRTRSRLFAWWQTLHSSRKGFSPSTMLEWTSWQPVQPFPVFAASARPMKLLLYLPPPAGSYLPVAISAHVPVNPACGLLRNWLLCGWLGKATVPWYGPTVRGRPFPLSVQVAAAAMQAPWVVDL